MKTILMTIAVTVAVALAAIAVPSKTYAGDQEWATAGKVLTGVAAVGLIAVLASQANHGVVSVHASYGPPPARYEPPRQWITSHYEIQRERVCLPAHWETVVDPAQYGWVQAGYQWVYVMTKPECVRRVWVPERVEWRETKVWVPAHFEVGVYAYNR